MINDPNRHAAHYIGKQYRIRLTDDEAAYVERVRLAQDAKTFSAAGRRIIQAAMAMKLLEEAT